jgi:hypothetical protein
LKVTVLESHAGRLIVRTGPYWAWFTWATRVAALVMAVVALIVVPLAFNRGAVRCNRATGQCEVVISAMVGSDHHQFAHSALRGAMLRPEGADPDGNGAFLLELEGRELVLINYLGNQKNTLAPVAETINAFVRGGTTADLDVGFSSWDLLVLSAIVAALAGFVAWWGRVTTLTLDRVANTFTIRKSAVIAWTRRGRLAEIAEATVETRGLRDGHRTRNTRHVARLVLTTGERVTIDESSELADPSRLISTIQGFLG